MKKEPKDSGVENTPMNTPKVERKRRNQEIDNINNIDKNTASLKEIEKEPNIENEPDKEKIDVIEKDTDTSLKETEMDPHQSRRPDWTSAHTISHEKHVKDVPSISEDEVAEDNTAQQPPAAKS